MGIVSLQTIQIKCMVLVPLPLAVFINNTSPPRQDPEGAITSPFKMQLAACKDTKIQIMDVEGTLNQQSIILNSLCNRGWI
mmetsp:Transcript_28806/g.52136  ORF Transcript_28806/g.52136 Transcript_28806/m.52136 type:complete len:81 (+) Transcript_28806:1090-1332(+)